MEKDPTKRLKIHEIKQHDFLKGISWEDVVLKNLAPSFLPSPERRKLKDDIRMGKKFKEYKDTPVSGAQNHFRVENFTYRRETTKLAD